MPVSATTKCSVTSVLVRTLRGDLQRHFAALGELDGVADQVDHHLPQAVVVADDAARHVGMDVAGQLQALAGARGRANDFIVSPRLSRRSKVVCSRTSLPASILEKSRMSLITESSASPESLDRVQELPLLRATAGCSRTSSVMPMMAFSGVRISWLMLARKVLLARLAASAASLACSNWALALASSAVRSGDAGFQVVVHLAELPPRPGGASAAATCPASSASVGGRRSRRRLLLVAHPGHDHDPLAVEDRARSCAAARRRAHRDGLSSADWGPGNRW